MSLPALCAVMAAAAAAPGPPPPAPAGAKDVLFIAVDDLRPSLGLYGATEVSRGPYVVSFRRRSVMISLVIESP
jgi:hypothetical protein